MKTITLSADNICGYAVKQEGYGRQGLYLELYDLDGCPDQTIYWGSVFPNPRENWGLHTTDEVFPKQRPVALDEFGEATDYEDIPGEFTDCSGNDVDAARIFPTIFDGIVAMVTGDEREVLEDDDNEGDNE